MRLTRVLTTLTLLSAVACGSSSESPTGVNGAGNSAGDPLSATIDGTAWSSPTPAVVRTNNIVSIAGIDLRLTASVSFAFVATTTGTYSLAFANSDAGTATVAKAASGWSSALPGGSGSVTLTTFTANHLVGTFTFDAVPATTGATGTIQVTNGKFDITY